MITRPPIRKGQIVGARLRTGGEITISEELGEGATNGQDHAESNATPDGTAPPPKEKIQHGSKDRVLYGCSPWDRALREFTFNLKVSFCNRQAVTCNTKLSADDESNT